MKEHLIDKDKVKKEIIIDLTGPEGNAFYLLGLAKKLSKELKMDFSSVQKEMTSGNYENLLEVFDNHFGNIVTLKR